MGRARNGDSFPFLSMGKSGVRLQGSVHSGLFAKNDYFSSLAAGGNGGRGCVDSSLWHFDCCDLLSYSEQG